MNRIKRYILALAPLSIALASCNYLDIEPIGQVIPHKVSEYRALLTDGYRSYPASSLSYVAILSDEYTTLNINKIYSSTEIEPIFKWDYNNTLMREFEWQNYYKSMFQALAVIDGIDTADQDSAESKNQLKGEALALKAYNHFMLCNLYAKWYDPATAATDKAIPLSQRIDIEQIYTPTTVAKVYESILDDLTQAIELMDIEMPVKDYKYRFSIISAKALMARVKLYQRNWQEAYDISNAILTQTPLVNFNKIAVAGSVDKNQQPWKRSSDETILAIDKPFSGAGNDIVYAGMVSADIISLYDKVGDLRSQFFKQQVNPDGLPAGTYYTFDRSSSDQTSIRSAEVYLIAAEAAANIPSLNERAKTILGTLYDNRLTAAAAATKRQSIAAMNGTQLIEEIADERQRELPGEGQRWFDLRRTTRATISKTLVGQTYTLRTEDNRYTIPYPKSAIDNNPELRQ